MSSSLTMRFVRFLPLICCLCLIFLPSGCGDSNPVNSFEPEIVNNPDDFIFRVRNAYLVTTRLTYNWTNSGQRATIEHLSGRTGGTGALTILDADGNTVYYSELKSSGTDGTSPGNAGRWTIVLQLNEYSGTIYFRVRKL
ncbi:MAG: hypothetical protein JSU74_00880 [Candidatus Zixiibacteriota bacterium]|nr:MAG: hypothetical protein JSU74_00880 [candidate division Zixibacteria bacterium]